MTAAELLQHVQMAMREQRWADAAALAAEAAKSQPNDPAIHAMHGSALRRLDRFDDAIPVLKRALKLNDRIPNAWLELARCHLGVRAPNVALEAVNRALALQPDSGVALGLAFDVAEAAGDLAAADRWFAAQLRADPRHLERRLALGNQAFDAGESARAIWHFKAYVQHAPDRLEGHLNLAAAHMQAGDIEAAAQALLAGIRKLPDAVRLRERLCELDELRQVAPADRVAHCEAWLALAPDQPQARLLLAYARLAAFDHPGARRELDFWLARSPTPWPALWVRHHYPEQPIYPDAAAEQQFRDEVRSLVTTLDADLDAGRIDAPMAARMLAACPNFHLGYLNDVDQVLPRAYAAVLRRLALCSGLSDIDTAARASSPHARRRVLVVSAHCRTHSVSRVWRDLICALPKDRFDLRVASLNTTDDVSTGLWRARADVYEQAQRTIPEWHTFITTQDADCIVYLDIGMEPISQALASLRLAPKQITTWGHPVSSGMATIDAFLSSDFAEPVDAAAHYNETLIRIPGIAASYRFIEPGPLPATPPKRGTRLICMQNAFKLMPDQDAAFRDILSALPDAELWFLASTKGPALAAFESRMRSALGDVAGDRVFFKGFLDYPEYCALLASADLAIDSWGWSGGLTSLDALSLGVPVVTWPGALMRGRQTTALLKLLDLPELIATDRGDYIERIVALARDPSARQALEPRLRVGRPRIEDDAASRTGVIRFFSDLLSTS